MVFVSVMQRAAELHAHNLAARVDLDQPARLDQFDQFMAELVREAKNVTLDGINEAHEAQAESFVCQMIGTVCKAPRRITRYACTGAVIRAAFVALARIEFSSPMVSRWLVTSSSLALN